MTLCAGGASFADHGKRSKRNAVRIILLMDLSITPDGQFQFFRQRIYYRDSHAMEPSGNLVTAVVKFSACV